MSSIWATLSAIDCSEHIEKKGQFSYLAWTWAWAMVKERYPEANYKILKDKYFHGSDTLEVRVEVTIEDLSHTMWLPVLDFKNKPIIDPNAFDINTARMRCLVKCLAMFGLGHYIYAGESFPAPPKADPEDYEQLVSLIANKRCWELRQFTEEKYEHMDELFNMAPQGKKTSFKSDYRTVYGMGNEGIKDGLEALETAIATDESSDYVTEILSEMDEIERAYVYKGMNETLRKQVEERVGEVLP